jgi:hypothetical protein
VKCIEKFGVNPWLRIWFHPQGTIRSINQFDRHYCVFPLGLGGGFALTLILVLYRMTKGSGTSHVLLFCLVPVLGVFLGLSLLHIVGAFLHFTGKLLGGKARMSSVRAAIAWSQLPQIMLTLLAGAWGLYMYPILFGQPLVLRLMFLIVPVCIVLLFVWYVVMLSNTLAAVQGFSAWWGLVNVIIPILLVFAVLFYVYVAPIVIVDEMIGL